MVEQTVGHFKEICFAQREGCRAAFSERLNGIEKAIDAHSKAMESALALAKETTEKRFEGVNYIRSAMNDQQLTYARADKVTSDLKSIDSKLEASIKSIDAKLETRTTSIDDKTGTRLSGVDDKISRLENFKSNLEGRIAMISIGLILLNTVIAVVFRFWK